MKDQLEKAETRYVQANGVTFAYRKLGGDIGTPTVFLQHFTGTMDDWDPAVVDALAANRPVIVFDNVGVGASDGTVPDTVEQMTTDAENFISALGYKEVDLLGFSLGGFIAQVMAARPLQARPLERLSCQERHDGLSKETRTKAMP